MLRTSSTKLRIAQGFFHSMALLVLISGCGIEPDTLNSITEVIHRGASSATDPRVEAFSDPFSNVSGGASGQSLAGNESPSAKGSNSFEPLYPERANPFVYPSDVESDSALPIGTSVAEIRVMGFANVENNSDQGTSIAESKVLLKTNSGIKLLAVGEQVGQIKVLRIDSPTVELKMGSLIWTATMFDR